MSRLRAEVFRGTGIGRQHRVDLFHVEHERAHRGHRGRGRAVVVGEVRDPRVWPETDDDRPQDRLRFYARNDCHALPAPWVQPGLEGGPREPGMLLLTMHGSEIGEAVASDPMVEWAAEYFAESEGGTPTDEQYRSVIDGLSKRLEVLAIDDYPSIPLL